ncbi:MAG: LysR substrate-binding domain-containing protein [Methylocystis sp.]|uniref:LysR substrate-binding domain-containing protein n=1 Tax=Methylocystis sp. TaxID=1911079 RepID=UPI003DA616BE
MTLDQLRIFIAVAEHEHMTRAASALNLAQSAASHAIAALEARHDVRLFDRVGRRIELTETGGAFLAEARAILAQVEHAERMLSEFGKLERGTLTIHASQTIAGYWLPRHLVAFRNAFPRVDIHLAINNSAHVAKAVESGVAEVGFVEDEIDDDCLVSATVARDQLLLVVSPQHRWADRRDLESSDLVDGDWVFRELGSGTRSAFERAVASLGISPERLRIAMELPSNEAVRAAVEAGLGAAAISATVAAPSIEAGLLRSVGFALPEREFYALRHKQRFRSRAANALLAIIERAAPERLARRSS